jgi:ferritin
MLESRIPALEAPVALTKTIQDALNEQLKHEFYSAYLYLSMSAYCTSVNLPGFAHWMRVQAQEEVGHAMKFSQYVEDRGGRVALRAIEQPPVDFKSPLDVLEQVRQHEQMVTGEINRLYALAVQEKDYASQTFLQWFLTEQVEEEKMSGQLAETLKMVGDNKSALLILDKEMGARAAGG